MEDIKIIKNFLDKSITGPSFDYLLNNIDWKDELDSADGKIKINRKMAYVYDKIITYSYANLSFTGELWNDCLEAIRNELNNRTDHKFNSVLLNLYEDGKDEIKWHSDQEEILGENPVIACINLGTTRKFWFREKKIGSDKLFCELEDGDLLIMGENCQKNYLHAILREKDITSPRISLTYRLVNQ